MNETLCVKQKNKREKNNNSIKNILILLLNFPGLPSANH